MYRFEFDRANIGASLKWKCWPADMDVVNVKASTCDSFITLRQLLERCRHLLSSRGTNNNIDDTVLIDLGS